MTFGHIARFNQHDFFNTFSSTTEGKVRSLRQTLAQQCWGDPTFSYSDVERALQPWLREHDVLALYENPMAQEQQAEERATLARPQAKYGHLPDEVRPSGLQLTQRGDK